MKKCCLKWEMNKTLEDRDYKGFYVEMKFCPQCGSSLTPTFSTSDFSGVITLIYKAIEKIGGKSDLLSIVGGWRDTMDDPDTIESLIDFLGLSKRIEEINKYG